MGSLIGYKGDIAILSATTEAPDQNTWIAAMKKTLAEDAEVQGHEAGRHRLRRRPAGEVDDRDGGAALQLPRPRGRHRADDRGRGGGGAGRAVRAASPTRST